MYGLSGASGKLNILTCGRHNTETMFLWLGRHCCLWCHVTSSQLSNSLHNRGAISLRTNATLERDLKAFNDDGGNIKKAKVFNNVIRKPYVAIDLEKASYIHVHQLASMWDYFKRTL